MHGRLIFTAQAIAERTLAKLGTEGAYRYFMNLKPIHGNDSAKGKKYRTLEYRYLKKYSKDPKVLNSPDGIFV